MKITKGKIMTAKKVVLYGPEGIGKSTLAARFPEPLFIDTEGSTKEMDVARLDKPESWEYLLAEIEFVRTNRPCKTLVIDTIDWAEQLCISAICDKHGKKGIEDFGYGNGWIYEKESFERFLTALEGVIHAGIHVVLTAHAILRKFEQPDELGSYDRWELKLGKKTTNLISPMIKEWADMVLFTNYKTLSVAVDKDGKKHKAQGGRRVMYTSHHPCWDAKNRYDLPEEIPMDYEAIRHIFADVPAAAQANTPLMETPASAPAAPPAEKQAVPEPAPIPTPAPASPVPPEPAAPTVGIPKALADLMTASGITEEQIRKAVASKGYFPEDMPIKDYPPDFISGVLVGAWEQVKSMIELDNYPF